MYYSSLSLVKGFCFSSSSLWVSCCRETLCCFLYLPFLLKMSSLMAGLTWKEKVFSSRCYWYLLLNREIWDCFSFLYFINLNQSFHLLSRKQFVDWKVKNIELRLHWRKSKGDSGVFLLLSCCYMRPMSASTKNTVINTGYSAGSYIRWHTLSLILCCQGAIETLLQNQSVLEASVS